jgi:retinal rod rhodopsin-sensitive cGMP 3',5'-cyclic phosphodiesterase subunit delta
MDSKNSGAKDIGGAKESFSHAGNDFKPDHKASSSSSVLSGGGAKYVPEEVLDREADEEFEALMRKGGSISSGAEPKRITRTSDPRALEILAGFKINHMNMRDGNSGAILWESSDWGADVFENEISERVPKEILKCKIVAREINFSSVQKMNKFRIEQRVYLHGSCIEEFDYNFGFVIPGSANTWQQTIVAADAADMIPPEVLSGNVIFESSFYDDNLFVCKCSVRMYYV